MYCEAHGLGGFIPHILPVQEVVFTKRIKENVEKLIKKWHILWLLTLNVQWIFTNCLGFLLCFGAFRITFFQVLL